MVVLNWFNEVKNCHVHTLQPLFEEVLYMKQSFDHISCQHIYREWNQTTNTLSKVGYEAWGVWEVIEHMNGANTIFFLGLLIEELLFSN